MADDSLIPKHGGYRKLKSFQVAQLCYDVTVRFCDRYIDKRSRSDERPAGPLQFADGLLDPYRIWSV